MTAPGYPERACCLGRLLLACGVLLAAGCDPTPAIDPAAPSAPAADSRKSTAPIQFEIGAPEIASRIRFASVGREARIDFTYYGSPSPQHFMPEQNGGGVALLDFDRDGSLDIFFPNGADLQPPVDQAGQHHHMYRAMGTLQYAEVSMLAGLEGAGWGMGCAAGDYDNDGFVDLYMTQYGKNRLWHNNGDGTFTDVTDEAGVGDDRWGTSAAFADLDRDGNLDLYVVNYVQWSADDPPCYTQHNPPVHISCGPIGRIGQPDVLYRNLGNSAFTDVSDSSGIIRPEPKGLGVAIADFDQDGWLDVYVANDTTENFLFRNTGGMQFEDVALRWGAAVGAGGQAHSGMGIACGDFDGDTHFDLVVTNFDNEVNDLYQNLNATGFRPANTATGLDAISRHVLGFGAVCADFDLDGWPDLFVANGHVWDLTSLGLDYTYAMPPQLIRNVKGKRFVDSSKSAGPYFGKKWLGRAVASGDLDGDGDVDLVVTHLRDPAELLRNDTEAPGKRVLLELIGTTAARQPLGCRVEVSIAGERRAYWLPAGGSFQAASDPRLIIPVGEAESIGEIAVQWPDGVIEQWRDIPFAPRITLRQGDARGS